MKYLIALFIFGVSTVINAQEQRCHLNIREGDAMLSAHPYRDKDIFNTTVNYEGAPLDSVGYFHNESQGIYCSGIVHDGYVVTISTCIKEIQDNGVKDFFTVIYDDVKYTAGVSLAHSYDAMGVAKLDKSLPFNPNTLTSRSYEKYLGKPGWLIRGYGKKDNESTLFVQDYCKLVSGSGTVYQYSCREKVNYQMGAVIMADLCDEWQVAGFMDGVGNIFMIEARKIEHLVTHYLGVSCKFNPTKPCDNVKVVYPKITTDSPELKMKHNSEMMLEDRNRVRSNLNMEKN